MAKVTSKEANVVSSKINELLEDWKPYINTITADNGKKIAQHKKVSEHLNIDYYFVGQYSPWERGANENLNRLIRQYFKKGDDFKFVNDSQIKQVGNKLNNRPRKRFDFKNIIFVMETLLFNQKLHL